MVSGDVHAAVIWFQVPCTLQWWDTMMSRFADYGRMDLSEHVSCSVLLPAVNRQNRARLAAAAIWRMRISQSFASTRKKRDSRFAPEYAAHQPICSLYTGILTVAKSLIVLPKHVSYALSCQVCLHGACTVASLPGRVTQCHIVGIT